MEMTYYKYQSMPLEVIKEEDVKTNERVYDELGKCRKKVLLNGNSYMVEVHDSVLREGELVSNLTDAQLKLFWTLSKNKLEGLKKLIS